MKKESEIEKLKIQIGDLSTPDVDTIYSWCEAILECRKEEEE